MTSVPSEKPNRLVCLNAAAWSLVNDVVMGGRSSATITSSDQGLLFEGKLSLANQGGFASCRHVLSSAPLGAEAVRLECRGDGRPYQIRLRQDELSDTVAWSAGFTSSGHWEIIHIPLKNFRPMFRGQNVPDAGPVMAQHISQLGLMIADGQAGQFELEVRTLVFVPDDPESPP